MRLLRCSLLYIACGLSAFTALAEPARFELNAIEIRDNTALSEAEVASIIAPYLNRTVTSDDLRELVFQFNQRYRSLGYINSVVTLPDQRVDNGTLKLQAREGELQEVRFVGYQPPRGSLSRYRFNKLSTPLNISQLQDVLRLVEREPMYQSVQGKILPGTESAGAALALEVVPQRPWDLSLHSDNYRSPSIGGEAIGLDAAHYNLTGVEDQLRAGVVTSRGQVNGYLNYLRPLGAGFEVELGYRQGVSDVVESTFRDLDIANDLDSQYLKLRFRARDELRKRLTFSLGLTRTRSQTELLDQPFSFALGADNGESVSVALVASALWTRQFDRSVVSLRGGIRQGVDAFDATINPGSSRDRSTGARLPDSRFTAFEAQFQVARRLNYRDSQLVLNGSWQYTSDPLLSVEKVALGGVRSVRGYRQNALVRDRGFDLSLEWRVPFRLGDQQLLQVVPFFDFGTADDSSSELLSATSTSISSLGIGLNWQPRPWLSSSLFWGHALNDNRLPDPVERDIQDDGFHFSIKVNLPR